MSAQDWAQLGGGALGGSTLPWVLGFLRRRLFRDAKGDAEARKLGVEADDLIVSRLWAEIDRLDRELTAVRKQLAEERHECDDRIQEMEGRIRQLQQRQTSAGNMASNQAEGPLRFAYPVIASPDQDRDLIGKLDEADGNAGKAKER